MNQGPQREVGSRQYRGRRGEAIEIKGTHRGQALVNTDGEREVIRLKGSQRGRATDNTEAEGEII